MPRLKPPRKQEEETIRVAPAPPLDEPIEIKLDDDPVETIEVSLAPEPKVEPKPTETDDALKAQVDAAKQAEDLQRRLTEAQRQSDENARLAREREVELRRERGDREDAQYNSVLTAIAAEQASLDKAESDYAAYAASNDWANASKAQRIMVTAGARLDRLQAGKEAFEERREEAKRAPPPRPAPQASTFEDRIKTLPGNAQTWLRSHPEFINDAARNNEIQAAHSYIVQRKGIAAFSDAYFEALDSEFGFKKSADPSPAPVPAPAPQPRKSIPMSAPVSRSVPSVASGKSESNTITLTAEERAVARNSFGPIKDADGNLVDMTPEQKERLYAQNKAKLARMRASGEYRQTTEQNG